ncbi:MAG: ATP-binding protein [Bacteroidetes bacterium]|nr:ATP-binding protein [Bacteroidota bacterium]
MIKQEYSFENEYLENSFQKDFSIPWDIGITAAKKGKGVLSLTGKPLFSIDFSGYTPSYNNSVYLLVFLFFLSFFSLCLAIYYGYASIKWLRNKPLLLVICFIADVLLLRIIQAAFNFPKALYTTALFSPLYYSSSILLPSAGDYLINSFIILLIAYVAYRKLFRERLLSSQQASGGIFSAWVAIVFILTIYIILCLGLEDIVKNSSFSIDLKDISKIGSQSIIGLLIVYCLIIAFYLLSKTAGSFADSCNTITKAIFIVVTTVCVFLLGVLWWDIRISIILAILFAGYLSLLLFYFIEKTKSSPFANIILPMFWMAVLVSTIFNFAGNSREREERKLIAIKLATEKNPVTELLYNNLERKLLSDTAIHAIVRGFDATKEEGLIKRIKSNYIREFWNRFTVQITVCNPGKMLRIQPRGYVFDCEQYFRQVCAKVGEKTTNPNLFFLDYGTGIETYLAILEPSDSTEVVKKPGVKIYIEFNAKTPAKDLGYPELLIDRRIMNIPDLSNYSYAMYQGGALVYKTGKFSYPMRFNDLLPSFANAAFFNSGGMDHYKYRMDKSRVLVISKKDDSLLGIVSPVSYLFIIFSFLTLVLNLIFKPDMFREFSFITLKNRFQIANVGIIVVSFLILGGLLLYFLIRLNNLKNMDSFSERTLSVLTEMEDKYGETENLEKLDKAVLEENLQRLSGMFYTDVNMYSLSGKLMLSSRPQVFDEGLISGRMNPGAFADLKKNRQSVFFQDERIGIYNYTSAYFPLYNDKNELLAYINLPFFSRQEDLKKEINDFLVAFMNLYILFILISAFISIAISRYLSAPLGILVSRMEGFQLGKRNEKIHWNHHDEIGRLVEEYNRLIDELAFSVDQLAKSERESAWREMARQVAHEIKNPLTPMKLSVQHLRKAWDDKSGDFNLRIQRFTKIMTEQIDSLSAIASEFSDFAKMPLPFAEHLDLVEILNSVISMYNGLENIQIILDKSEGSAIIIGDKKQLVRVFTNLLNNATQAISKKENGLVKIAVQKLGNLYSVDIADNGDGIPDEIYEKIFLPNFTTKSGGAGLGLAIVRGIIRGMGGDVKFASGRDGTVFTVTIPLHYDTISL